MLSLLIKIFAFYFLFVIFKTVLRSLTQSPAQGPKVFKKSQNVRKSDNADVIDAEYRVIKD